MFRGTYTALITPFAQDESVDFDALEKLVQSQIDAGIEGLVVLGTTGESPTITTDERREITRKIVAIAKGKCTIIVGTGTNSTASTIRYSKYAEEDGADALLVVNPYYNKPSQEGLYQHFWTVADNTGLPVILYNIAGRTGVNLETETLVRLAEHSRIVGVKEASGDLAQMQTVINQTDDDFSVLSGDDALTVKLIEMGGDGVVSVLSNILPVETKEMLDTALSGDARTAHSLHTELSPLMDACFIETNPVPAKTVLAAKGMCEEVFRLPLCSMQSENKEKVLTAFA